MFEQDYIMRLIKEMVRAILKLLFNLDAPAPTADLFEDESAMETADGLIKKANAGYINEAENELFDLIETRTMDNFLVGLSFYSHLNEMDNDFLLANGFSREEVREGLKSLVAVYGLGDMAEIFFYD